MADKIVESSPVMAKNDVEVVELPAPKGWQKKCLQKKGGTTPRRNEIIFISPTGEEVKNKKQLTQYLKSHPGGPESSEFDWGTGDTPRRSARLGEKAKAVETPEGEKPKKRERKSSSKKGAKDKDDEEADDSAETKENVTKEETKDAADIEMKETGEKSEGEGVAVVVTVNEDVNIEVSVDERAAVEIATEGVNESAVMPDPENKINVDVEEKHVDSAVKKDEPEINADIFASYIPKDPTKLDAKPTESESLLPTHPNEVFSAENGEKGEATMHENCSHKDNENIAVVKETPSVTNNDGKHQPKASPISC